MPDYDTDFHPEPRADVVRRRLKTIPRSILLFVLFTALAPVVFTVALIVDAVRFVLFRRPFMAVRMLAFGWIWLYTEMVGLTRFFLHWVGAGFGRNRKMMVERAYVTQAWWARVLFASVQRLFRLDVQVEGLEVANPGPVLAMFRHASIIDNLLPAALLTDQRGLKLRWLIKKELLQVPSLDVGGNRLPNYFVDRNADDPREELRRIRALTRHLSEDEGLLIYPEGTRFTESRRTRALEKLQESASHLYERAANLRYVLPPKIGGVLSLLDAKADPLICAHEGLGGFAKVSDIWSGAMLNRTIRVKLWRVDFNNIPTDRKGRVDWLFDQWEAIDNWIASVMPAEAAAG
ncbi:MAG: 1-acyl-sn-glycerol-3-phosphate acyltransferase [Acidimicrobiia bacterium]|nr:1-acyl-sn-glycerol-3-phosphate acyltransferase [Acidimicrobiia bacterium]